MLNPKLDLNFDRKIKMFGGDRYNSTCYYIREDVHNNRVADLLVSANKLLNEKRAVVAVNKELVEQAMVSNAENDYEPTPINPDDYEEGMDLKSGGENIIINGKLHCRKSQDE